MARSKSTQSYSDKTRPRRQQRKSRRKNATASTKKPRRQPYGLPEIPPVMVRGGFAGIPFPSSNKPKKKVRRRYDMTLNVPGAEMRLPAFPQVSFGFRLISVVFFIALGMLLYHFWESPNYQVDAAEVVGLQRLTSHDVNAVLDVAGEPIFAVDAASLQDRLVEAFPEFSSVDIQVGFPNNIRVIVEERVPILTWQQDGRSILVDANGMAFPLRDLVDQGQALVVQASDAPPAAESDLLESDQNQFMPVEMVSAILSMSALAPENNSLIFNAQHGLGWKDVQGWDVYFGSVFDIDMKLRIYRAMVDKFAQESISPSLISVEYVHAPFYR